MRGAPSALSIWRSAFSYQGYRYTSGAIIAKGKIVAGMTGCERYKNDVCFVTSGRGEVRV